MHQIVPYILGPNIIRRFSSWTNTSDHYSPSVQSFVKTKKRSLRFKSVPLSTPSHAERPGWKLSGSLIHLVTTAALICRANGVIRRTNVRCCVRLPTTSLCHRRKYCFLGKQLRKFRRWGCRNMPEWQKRLHAQNDCRTGRRSIGHHRQTEGMLASGCSYYISSRRFSKIPGHATQAKRPCLWKPKMKRLSTSLIHTGVLFVAYVHAQSCDPPVSI